MTPEQQQELVTFMKGVNNTLQSIANSLEALHERVSALEADEAPEDEAAPAVG